MERWCPVVLLVLCSVVLTLSGVEADDRRSDDHCCTYFYQMDFDGDIRLTVDDYLKLLERGTNLTGIIMIPNQYQTRDEKIDFLVKQNAQFFPLVNDSLDDALFTDGVSLDDFLESMTGRRNTKELEQTIVNWITGLFDRFTSDPRHKNMTLNEFQTLYSVLHIDPKATIAVFKYMDENDDEKVSLYEMVSDAIDYFSLANDPNNISFGTPTITCDIVAIGSSSTY